MNLLTTSIPPAPRRSRRGLRSTKLRGALQTYLGVGTVLIILFAFFTASQPEFATTENMLNVLETSSVLLIVSVGLTFTLLVAGFDLSISGVLAFSGIVLAKLLMAGVPTGFAIAICLLGGLMIGVLLLGIPIARYGVSFFIVSLGVLVAMQGLALLISNGSEYALYDEGAIRWIGSAKIAGISFPVYVAGFVFLVGLLVLRYTGFGRMIYAVGGNTEAARLAGINVVRVRVAAYAISATLSALAGVIEAGRLAAASPQVDKGIEFTAAAAVLLGGTSFVGGVGTLTGTLLGVMFLGVLNNGLIIASISVYWKGVITGVVLLLSVAIDRVRQGRAMAARKRG